MTTSESIDEAAAAVGEARRELLQAVSFLCQAEPQGAVGTVFAEQRCLLRDLAARAEGVVRELTTLSSLARYQARDQSLETRG